ncbi:spermidine/putrescine transport system ATP-binding protein|uniref:Spermidine/putrescine import ATP-binding protein PotA n=1 Tax=Brenneria salicis ATCC 15712 = DSM 30166 TaxID=714314 RepID=A0A366IE66_9GAMM|nr:ABC transporter ATP-binding protein [Brenneria salicis]NMN92369.1 spermidine/putrescine transport system ATP-binding protein [Brenneria salicis ATCC 15712 = DSM 30166]RBP67709.1 spermidine/putrescine transport system ATP-binding protein [Brenneria salicis ATCC 15712 = DSM 30166]RLM32320.1 polyamine ABC transporter ATP-binding protein [Brenneria salicis ATCC 15712 = DSM 30166]
MNDSHNFRSVVTLDNAVKYYQTPEGGNVKALDGINLQVRDNEFVTLLGPSGCGKTTLLRVISGFESLDSGELQILGNKANDIPAHRRPVNTVFQSYALFPHLNIADNVGYGLDVQGVLRSERNRRVAETLEMVGMLGMEKRKPSQLSGGQQQRVALARAIVNRPTLLLLDEPLSALDRHLRQNMQLELKRLQTELKISFIFVTHDQEEALTMSDRIIVLNGGKIQQNGDPTAIYDQPANRFVAGFIGESNLIDVCITDIAPDHLVLTSLAGDVFNARVKAGVVYKRGARWQLLLRPQHFLLQKPNDDNVQYARIDGIIRQVIFMGKDIEVIFDSGKNESLKVLIGNRSLTTEHAFKSGDTITLWYDIASCHLLPCQEDANV